MEKPKKVENRQIIGMIENIHLLRQLFIKRTRSHCPLHFSQITIMRLIEQNKNCTQSELAEMLHITPASVATSTKRLQKAGLITKTVDSENLRCKRLALTDKGRKVSAEGRRIFVEYDSVIFEDFSEDDKIQFFDYLERLILKMKETEGISESMNSPIELGMLLHRLVEITDGSEEDETKT